MIIFILSQYNYHFCLDSSKLFFVITQFSNFLLQTPSPGPLGVFPKDIDGQEDEVTYADADYKDIYEFGPVSYKNASEEAAARKKAELATRFNNPKYNYYTPAPKSNKQD